MPTNIYGQPIQHPPCIRPDTFSPIRDNTLASSLTGDGHYDLVEGNDGLGGAHSSDS